MYSIELSPEDVRFYRTLREQREQESQAWLKVRDALSEYITMYVDTTENAEDVEQLVSIFLPDLVDEIVEEIQRGEA